MANTPLLATFFILNLPGNLSETRQKPIAVDLTKMKNGRGVSCAKAFRVTDGDSPVTWSQPERFVELFNRTDTPVRQLKPLVPLASHRSPHLCTALFI